MMIRQYWLWNWWYLLLSQCIYRFRLLHLWATLSLSRKIGGWKLRREVRVAVGLADNKEATHAVACGDTDTAYLPLSDIIWKILCCVYVYSNFFLLLNTKKKEE